MRIKNRIRKLAIAFSLLPLSILSSSTLADEQQIIDSLNHALKQHDVVGFGEAHGLDLQYPMLVQWISSDEFQALSPVIFLEFGNALYQSSLDKFVKGPSQDPKLLFELLNNTTQSPVDVWHLPGYSQVLKAVQQSNLRNNKSIEVIAGDPPIDWQKVNNNQDYRKFTGRDAFMTSQIKTHALSKGKKAVVLIGGAHLPKKRSRKALSLSQRLNKEGASVYAVQVLAGLPPKVKQQYQAQLNEIPAMSFLDLNEHWLGELAAPVRPGTKPSELLKRKDSYDAIVFLGPLKELMYQTGTKENLSDDVWWQELNRRSQIRFGHPLQEKSKNSSRLEPVAWR